MLASLIRKGSTLNININLEGGNREGKNTGNNGELIG
jgi:hypothetical protein